MKDGILLGVMGTDVPLKELIKLTPEYKVEHSKPILYYTYVYPIMYFC